MANLIESTTPLNDGQTFTSDPQTVERAYEISGSVFSDRSGVLSIEQSGDGDNWDVSTTYAIAANDGKGFEETILLPFFRIKFENNSGGDQTTFRIYANARASSGAFLADLSEGLDDNDYFVLWFNPNIQDYVAVGQFAAADGVEANDQAALETGNNGKYAAFQVLQASVTAVEITQATESEPVGF